MNETGINRWVRGGMAAVAGLVLSGCAHLHETAILHDLAHDHTLDAAGHPVRTSAKVVWRTRTFLVERIRSVWLDVSGFPRLGRRDPEEIDPERAVMDPHILASYLERRAGPAYAGEVDLIMDGEAFFTRFIEALKGAEERIDIQVYIFDNDDVGRDVADLLRERAREIPVRVLLDSIGTRRAWSIDAPSIADATNPGVGNMIRYLRRDGLIDVRRSRNTLLSSDHSKGMIIDGRLGFFGGMNIGREYRHDWRDTMLEVRGPLLVALQEHFARSWQLAGPVFSRRERVDPVEPTTDPPEGEGYYMLHTTPIRHDLYGAKLLAIRSAQRRIYVENPYLWNRPLLHALCEARQRGVDVRVTLPQEVNIGVGKGANRMVVNLLLRHEVRVYLHPGMTHVKAAVFDDWASIGTSNFDALSMHKNYETNIFTRELELVERIAGELLREGRERSVEVLEPVPVSLWDRFAKRVGERL